MQGINDLVTPFLAVFLSGHFQGPVEQWGDVELPEQARTSLGPPAVHLHITVRVATFLAPEGRCCGAWALRAGCEEGWIPVSDSCFQPLHTPDTPGTLRVSAEAAGKGLHRTSNRFLIQATGWGS